MEFLPKCGTLPGSPTSLCAQGRVFIGNRQGYGTHTGLRAGSGQWPGDVIGTLEFSGVARHGGSERLEIYGSEGTLVYDFSNNQLLLGRPGDAQPAVLTAPPEFQAEWTVERDFIRAIRNQEHPEPSFETGVRYMEFVEAVQRSMAESAWVTLSSL